MNTVYVISFVILMIWLLGSIVYKISRSGKLTTRRNSLLRKLDLEVDELTSEFKAYVLFVVRSKRDVLYDIVDSNVHTISQRDMNYYREFQVRTKHIEAAMTDFYNLVIQPINPKVIFIETIEPYINLINFLKDTFTRDIEPALYNKEKFELFLNEKVYYYIDEKCKEFKHLIEVAKK